MTGLRRTTARVVASVMVVAGLVAAGLGSPAGATDHVTVVWPATTRLNPDTTPYAVEVTYAGTGTVWLTGAATGPQPLAVSGATDVTFGDDGTHSLAVWECPDAEYDGATCSSVGTRSVATYRSLHLTWLSATLGPARAPSLRAEPQGMATGEVTWEVLAPESPASPPLVSGTGSISSPCCPPAIGLTDALTHGSTYLYRATMTAAAGEFGNLTGTVGGSFVWDSSVDAVLKLSRDKFWPWRKGEPGRVFLEVRPSDPKERLTNIRIRVLKPGGRVLVSGEARDGRASGGWGFEWRGPRRSDPGDYDVEALVRDRDGNWATLTGSVEIGTTRIAKWTRTFRAVPTVIKVGGGRCSAVYRPARPSWPGSVAYRSYYHYGRGNCGSRASTISGVYVPRVARDRYRGVRVSLYGGPAREVSGGLLALEYQAAFGRWVSLSRFFTRRDGRLDGAWAEDDEVVKGLAGDGRPYVIWQLTAPNDSKMDVKTFTVAVKYEVYE